MGQVWTIASGKGGVGKTMITAALGTTLSSRHLRCAVMDGDIGLRNLDLWLGMENRIVFDVLDVAKKECKLKYALVQNAKHPALSLLPASQMGDPADLDADALAWVLEKLKKHFTYVFMDAPAGLGPSVHAMLKTTDEILLVTTPDDIAIRDAERLIALSDEHRKSRPLLVVNMIYPELVCAGEMYSPRTVANVLDIPLLGFIPHDLQVLRAASRHEPFMDTDCPAKQAMDRICRRFTGDPVPMPEFHKKRSRIWRRKKKEGVLL